MKKSIDRPSILRSGFSPKEVKRVTGGVVVSGEATQSILGISIDSRTVQPGELFIAIRGHRFDGHEFVKEALMRGAAGAVVEHWPLQGLGPATLSETDSTVWQVPESRKVLVALARYHRDRFGCPVVAITGSSGKTTTKTMLVHILSPHRKVLFTPGTQNNLIGVPMTLFKLHRKHQMVVLELGANQWGEIRRLTKLSRPSIGVVTNIGPAHLQTFKDLQGVLRAKAELWEAMDPTCQLVLNADDPLIWKTANDLPHPVIWYGTSPKADLRASQIVWESWGCRCRINDRFDLYLPQLGRHSLMNALAALACAQALGEELPAALERLWDLPSVPGRLAISRIEGTLFLDDTYNANPDSLKAALEVLGARPCEGRKILVVGDMLELGEQAEALHVQAGQWVAASGVDFLIAVGPLARTLLAAAWEAGLSRQNSRAFHSVEEAGEFLFEIVGPKDVVLVKGSRGMQMERLLKCSTSSSTH